VCTKYPTVELASLPIINVLFLARSLNNKLTQQERRNWLRNAINELSYHMSLSDLLWQQLRQCGGSN